MGGAARIAQPAPGPAPLDPPPSPTARTAAAWRALSATLWGWLRRRVGDDATADDLLQTVFLRVHVRGGQLQDVERLDAWVWQVARRVWIDHQRARRFAVDIDAAAEEPALAVDPESPDELAALAQWLAAQIDALPPTLAAAVRLTELEGLTMQEAALRLGLSVSGVKSRVQRGRAELRRVLLRCCAVEVDRQGAPVDFRRKPLGSGCGSGCEGGTGHGAAIIVQTSHRSQGATSMIAKPSRRNRETPDCDAS